MKGNCKIALFLPSLQGGGAERVMVNLARGFSARGLTVDLVLAKREGPYLTEVPDDVRVIDLGASRVVRSLPGLVRYLRLERPDAMISTLSHANLVAIWARMLSRVPLRLIIREADTLRQGFRRDLRPSARFIQPLMKRFYRYADLIVANSNDTAQDIREIIKIRSEKIRVIHNPVFTEELARRSKEPVRHPWLNNGQEPVIISVGRLTAQKDYATLIRAIALLRQAAEAKLIILGEGEDRKELEALIQSLRLSDSVHLAGFVDNPYAWVARAQCFVLSSRWEGFGNVLVEALAVGTPVVSTDCPGGPREILEGGKWGILTKVGSPRHIADAVLATLAADKHLNGSKRARAFSLETISAEYLRTLLPNSEMVQNV